MAIIKDPTSSDMKTLVDISFEPFRRKQSDLNYYIAQSIRIYGKEMVYDDKPVSAYIRGFEIDESDDKSTLTINPGVVMANNSFVILKKKIELTRPSVSVHTYVVVEYHYIDQWQPPVPEFKFISQATYNSKFQAIIGEIYSNDQFAKWDNVKRQEESRKIFGFLSDLYTDQVYTPDSSWPISSKAVQQMMTGSITNAPMFYGTITTDASGVFTLHMIAKDKSVETQVVASTQHKDIGAAFRTMLSDNKKFPMDAGYNIVDCNLTYTFDTESTSAILMGRGELDPKDMQYIELYNGNNMGGLSDKHIRGHYIINEDRKESTFIAYGKKGEYKKTVKTNSSISAITMFQDYLVEKGVSDVIQHDYTFEYWDEKQISKENVVIYYYKDDAQWTERRVRVTPNSINGGSLGNGTITSDKFASGLSLKGVNLKDGTIENSVLKDVRIISSANKKFALTDMGHLLSAYINDATITKSKIENSTFGSSDNSGLQITAEDNKITNASLSSCKINETNCVDARAIKGQIPMTSVAPMMNISIGEITQKPQYINNITNISFNTSNFRGHGSVNGQTCLEGNTFGHITLKPGMSTRIEVNMMPYGSFNFDTEFYTLLDVMVDDVIKKTNIHSFSTASSVWKVIWTNHTQRDQSIHLYFKSFFEDGNNNVGIRLISEHIMYKSTTMVTPIPIGGNCNG